MRTVDIIIPIYNALDDLRICLESLYKNTDLERHRLILINDNSPDEKIRPYLEEQKQRAGQIIVIHNEENRGFSNNINLGISQSEESDVILLNSDTILTKGWVEKMLDCAYSHRSIGTVTPLSNNATLCSVPRAYEENTLPEGMDVQRAADIIERHSMKKYPRIPVAVGFCMLIKREVIQAIGTFDAETFGRGYGEENDFCCRAEQAGYIHVMCDDTYIYHTGTKSFETKEREAYKREHDKILQERYPSQMHKSALYYSEMPNIDIAENVGLWFALDNGKAGTLYVVGEDDGEKAEGESDGAQLSLREQVESARKEQNVYVLAREDEFLRLTAYPAGGDGLAQASALSLAGDPSPTEYVFLFYVGKKEEFPPISDRRVDEVVWKVREVFDIGEVRIHHISNVSMGIFDMCREIGISVGLVGSDVKEQETVMQARPLNKMKYVDNRELWEVFQNAKDKAGEENGSYSVLVRELKAKQRELDRINNSIAYRLSLKILRIRFPFRRQIKKILKKDDDE